MEDSGARDECQDLLRSRLDDQEAYDGLLQDLGDVGRTACDVLGFPGDPGQGVEDHEGGAGKEEPIREYQVRCGEEMGAAEEDCQGA